MDRSNDLCVSPIKRYRVPKYPSHSDPDPTRFPYPVEYPWNSQAVMALASLGIAASCSREPNLAVTPPDHMRDVVAAADGDESQVENPFTLSSSGLPHVSSPFGTGAPNYLDDEIAREAIERVFRQAGYRLRHRYQYDRGGITFLADGYDDDHHVGYIYGGYENLDRDALGWVDPEPGNIEMIDYGLERLAEGAEYEKDRAASSEILAIQRLSDPVERESAYREYLKVDRREKLSLAEAQRFDSQGLNQSDFIAIISHFDARFTVPRWSEELDAEYRQAALIADPVKRAALINAVQERVAQDVINDLEQKVRDYISWARSQGLR